MNTLCFWLASLVTIATGSWYPFTPETKTGQVPPGDSSLVSLAKKVDELYGDQTARLVCQQALTNHILQSIRGPSTPSSTPQPDIAPRVNLEDYYSMIPTYTQFQTLGYLTNAIGTTKNVVQRIMNIFGY